MGCGNFHLLLLLSEILVIKGKADLKCSAKEQQGYVESMLVEGQNILYLKDCNYYLVLSSEQC